MKIISISIAEELHLKLKALAQSQDRSVSYVISKLVQAAVDDPLAKPASFEQFRRDHFAALERFAEDAPQPRITSVEYVEYPDPHSGPREAPVSAPRGSCQFCLNLGRACSRHRIEPVV